MEKVEYIKHPAKDVNFNGCPVSDTCFLLSFLIKLLTFVSIIDSVMSETRINITLDPFGGGGVHRFCLPPLVSGLRSQNQFASCRFAVPKFH